MKDEIIREIQQEMLDVLDNAQLKTLEKVLEHVFFKVEVRRTEGIGDHELANAEYAERFYVAKALEGCSARTIRYYRQTIGKMLATVKVPILHLTTERIRDYLTTYQTLNGCGKVSLDNVRRILSSFFAWLEDENYIIKSPIRRIHKIRATRPVKEIYTDEAMERLRDHCGNARDLAMVDLLASTGMRVGELVGLNRSDIDFEKRECIVFGKGAKERPVYFDARTKLHLEDYLALRTDSNPALFVSLLGAHRRLAIPGVEIRLRGLGRRLGLGRVHPHKFRRTLATRAIDKGMPIEQVQKLLGHSKIDTTMEYALVNQNNVKLSHHRYLA